MLAETNNGDNSEKLEGFVIDLLDELSSLANFQYTVKLVPDGNYGAKTETGLWNGMVRELIDERADLAAAPLTISYVREQVIDFTKPFLNVGISILFKMPRLEKPGLFSFLNPLAVHVWLCVIGAYLLVSFSIFALARFSPYERNNQRPCDPNMDNTENTLNLRNSFWFTVGTLMQQGSDVNPAALSTRIIGGTWWFFTLIIISSYTANLAAFLTVELVISPIDNVDDLSKQTDIAYGTRKSGSTFSFFRDSQIDTYQAIYAHMKRHPKDMQDSYEQAIKQVLEGDYAFFMENTMIEYQVQRNCDLMQVGGLLDSKGYGLGTPLKSPYRDKLSLAILKMRENGRIQMLYNKWWKERGTCLAEENARASKTRSLGVENVGGIFVILITGLTLSAIVAVCEFLWKSYQNAQEDKKTLCTEMFHELRFALRCPKSIRNKVFYTRRCTCFATNDDAMPQEATRAYAKHRKHCVNGEICSREIIGRSRYNRQKLYHPDFSRRNVDTNHAYQLQAIQLSKAKRTCQTDTIIGSNPLNTET